MEPPSTKTFMSSNGYATMTNRIGSFRPYSGDTSSSSSASSTTRGRRRFRRRPRPEPVQSPHTSRFPRCESAPNISSREWLSGAGISEVAIVVKASVSQSMTGLDKIRRASDSAIRDIQDDDSISSMSSFGDQSCVLDRVEGALPQEFECLDIHMDRRTPVNGGTTVTSPTVPVDKHVKL